MIILPDRTQPRGRILMPMRLRDWSPSDEHGHVPVHRWCVRARLNDGHIVRELWFDDREEADAFLVSRVMGTPWPHYEPLEYPAHWQILVNVTLTTVNAANQTYNVPADYVTAGSVWTVIASGGSGALFFGANVACGGGGGACSRQTNVALTPSGSTLYRVTAGGAGAVGDFGATGLNGTDCWFGGSTLAASVIGAKSGLGLSAGATTGGPGGLASGGFGAVRTSGGNGGTCVASTGNTSGGGGAGGPTSNGVNGVAAPATGNDMTEGGAGDGGLGGAGGNTPGVAGGNGTEIGGGVGAGGGGGSSRGVPNGGAGGLYGGGGGAAQGGTVSGAGAQGLVFGTYGAATSGGLRFNMPMSGL